MFNVNDGFAEAIVRGYRSAFLTQDDYRRIGASDNLEGMYSHVILASKSSQTFEQL